MVVERLPIAADELMSAAAAELVVPIALTSKAALEEKWHG